MKTINIVIAGLGGQGIVKSSDILADAAFRAGFDVKKAEVHGMSQRGGSVNTDIRFGTEVLSPMVPDGEADVMVIMEPSQVDNNKQRLGMSGKLILSDCLAEFTYGSPRVANVAMLGVLSAALELSLENWHEAIKGAFAERYHEMNLTAFNAGREWAKLAK